MQPTPAELARLDLFRGLSGAAMVEARSCFHAMTVASAEVLMGQDQVATWMALVMDGGVTVSRGHAGDDEVEVARLGPGEVIGEMGLMGGLARRTATVRTVGVTRLLVLDQWGLARLRRIQPEVAERLDAHVARSLSQRLRATTSAIGRHDPPRGRGGGRSPRWLRWLDGQLLGGEERPDAAAIAERSAAFAGLELEERRRLVRAVRVRRVPRGIPLVDEGVPAGRGFVLASGEVELTRQAGAGEAVLDTLQQPGEAFGFASLIDDAPSRATCRTTRASWVLELDRAALADPVAGALVKRAAIGAVTRRLGVADRMLGRLMR